MCKIKAIFFDIYDTLYSTSKFAHTARRSSIEAMIKRGLLNVTVDQCMEELQEVISEFGSNCGHHYDLLLRRLPKECCQHNNPMIIIAAGVTEYNIIKNRILKPYKEVTDFFKKIQKANNITLGVISEGITMKQADKLMRLGLLDYFDPNYIFITDRIGIGKINPKLYQNICTKVNIDPNLCMNVGDNPLMDIDPANKIGMTTVLVKGGEKSKHMGETEPDHVVSGMLELLDVLEKKYDIPIGQKSLYEKIFNKINRNEKSK